MRLQHTLLLLLTRDQEEQHSPATVLLCCANYRLEEDLIEFTCATRGSSSGTRGRLFSWKLLLSLSEHYSRVQAMQATVTQCAIRAIVFGGGGGGRRGRERESGRLTVVESAAALSMFQSTL